MIELNDGHSTKIFIYSTGSELIRYNQKTLEGILRLIRLSK